MSDRDVLREYYLSLIEEQLNNSLEPSTIKMYQNILDHGIEKSRGIELLAFYLERYFKENDIGTEFESKKWAHFLSELTPVYHLPGEYEFDNQEERKNYRNITRSYGKIKDNTNMWEKELYAIESHLFVYSELFEINSYEAKKIIHIVINRLFDFKNGYTSDYTSYTHEDILSLADDLESCCNPYVNPQLYDYLKQFVDLENKENFSVIFKSVFLVLTKILDSIDFHEKRSGKDGYFDYISLFIDLEICYDQGPLCFFNEHTLKK